MPFVTAVDPASSTPLHRQIYEDWRQAILTGRFRHGERLPSTRELATTLTVSRSTVTQAYEQLLAEGYLESARGSGTFVCRQLPDQPLGPGKASNPGPAGEPPIRLSRYGAGLDEDFLYPTVPTGFIHFAQWRPDLDQFPFVLWRKLITRHLRDAAPAVFDYAAHSAGFEPLRAEIAAYLSRSRAVACAPEQVLIVNGSQQGLDLCVRLLLDPGDEVSFENPGYQGARRILAAYGAKLRPARIDAGGIVVRDLAPKARLVYVTPSHQFPTGVSMSLGRRLELIEWARQRGAVLIEDDYDSEYRYGSPPLPSLQGLANGVSVLYIGTFSKVMFPGLRIGYVVAPRSLAAPLARAKWLADRHTPVLEQMALADFLSQGHLDRHVRRMRRLYGRRRQVLVEALGRQFGTRTQVLGDSAGMHLLARFNGEVSTGRVHLASSAPYYLSDPQEHEYVLGFSSMNERAIREGVRRLS